MKRFRGVATQYLAHYLDWHRGLTYGERHSLGEVVLRWPVEYANNFREQNLRGAGGMHLADGVGARPRFEGSPPFLTAPSSPPSAPNRAGP